MHIHDCAQQAGLAFSHIWHVALLARVSSFFSVLYVSVSTLLTVCFLLFLSLSFFPSSSFHVCLSSFCPHPPPSPFSLSIYISLSLCLYFAFYILLPFFSFLLSLPPPALPKFVQRRAQFDSVSLVIQGSMEGEMSLMDNLSGSICHYYALPPKFSKHSGDKKVNNRQSDDSLPPRQLVLVAYNIKQVKSSGRVTVIPVVRKSRNIEVYYKALRVSLKSPISCFVFLHVCHFAWMTVKATMELACFIWWVWKHWLRKSVRQWGL